jgi:hypothetical protein
MKFDFFRKIQMCQMRQEIQEPPEELMDHNRIAHAI